MLKQGQGFIARQKTALMASLLLISFTAQAIVSYGALDPKETPLILSLFDEGVKKHAEEYKEDIAVQGFDEVFKSFWFKTVDAEVAEKIILELQKTQVFRDRTFYAAATFHEFRRLQEDVASRGFEPSTNTYWAPPVELSIFYPDDAPGGPKVFVDEIKGQKVEFYNHVFNVRLELNYQQAGQELVGHSAYLKVYLEGRLHIICEQPFQNCRVRYSSIDRTGLEWASIPGHRGGNSSSGGSKGQQLELGQPVIIKFPKIEKPKLEIPVLEQTRNELLNVLRPAPASDRKPQE